MTHSACHSIDLILEVTGSFSPADPDVGVDSSYEDLDVEDMKIETRLAVGKWISTSILTNVDTSSPAIRQLFSNILKLKTEEIIQELHDANAE